MVYTWLELHYSCGKDWLLTNTNVSPLSPGTHLDISSDI